MFYLERSVARQLDPGLVLPRARAIVSCAVVYNTDRPYSMSQPRDHAAIARYAWGDDYHAVLERRLEAFESWMREQAGGECLSRRYVEQGRCPRKRLPRARGSAGSARTRASSTSSSARGCFSARSSRTRRSTLMRPCSIGAARARSGRGNENIPDRSLSPALLLSMPQLADPNFGRAVVLLCKYAPEGAFGLVINRSKDFAAADVVQLMPPVAAPNDLPLWIGGPVEPERGWILLSETRDDDDARELAPRLFRSASPSVLRRVLESSMPPPARVIAGYAGWGPGQLDQELTESSWLLAEVDAAFLFSTPAAELWEAAIRRLGADPSQQQQGHGVH